MATITPLTDDNGRRLWGIDEQHPDYGTVAAMGTTGGEAYRWFDDGEGNVAMIPLSMLQEMDQWQQ